MSVPAWKWLLQALDDELLISFARTLKVRVPGFRGGNWDKSIKLLRPRIIQSMLAPKQLMKLSEVVATEVQQDPELLALQDCSEQQLLEQVPHQLAPTQVLLALLSSPEPALVERGESLYQHWEDSGLLATWLDAREQAAAAAPEADTSQKTELAHCQQQLNELAAQLKKRERKTQKLAAELAKQKTNLTRAQRRWQQERKQLTSQLSGRENELKAKDAQLVELEATLLEQSQLIAQLQEEASFSSAEPEDTGLGEQVPTGLAKVAIVGNLKQDNLPVSQYADLTLLHVDPDDLQSEQTQELLGTVDQVWLLTYATPLPLQRRLRQLVPSTVLSCFDTYQDYMHNLGQGV